MSSSPPVDIPSTQMTAAQCHPPLLLTGLFFGCPAHHGDTTCPFFAAWLQPPPARMQWLVSLSRAEQRTMLARCTACLDRGCKYCGTHFA